MRTRQDRALVRLIVGLGNPGRQYAKTRHNVGFWCVDRLARENSITFSRRHPRAVIGQGVIAGVAVALAKPRTFVNNSGSAVSYLLDRYGISPADLLVIYDDMDVAQGKLRLRLRGSAGGHNGMKSIIEAIGTQDFARVRVGIDRPPPGVDEVEYVLGTVSTEERIKIDDGVEGAVQSVAFIFSEGFDLAMDRFN